MVVENLKMAFGAVILIGIMIWTLSIFWPEAGNEVIASRDSVTDNATMKIGVASNLAGDNCFDTTYTCTNYTGGTVGTALNSGNFTVTEATCSVTLAAGSPFNDTNVQCSYQEENAISGNFTEMYTNTPERTNTIITVSLAVLVIIILIGVYGYFTRVT